MNRNRTVPLVLFSFACILFIHILEAAPGETELCLVKDNKKAGVVLTTDDGLLRSVKYFVSQWKIYGLRGTAALIAGDISNWQEWIDLVNDGYLDIGNHSMNHPYLPDLNLSQLDTEINGAKAEIEARVPGYKVICFLCPEGAYNDQVVSVIEEQHAANRVVDRGYNSFTPTQQEIYRLKRQQILSDTRVSEMNEWIDEAISRGRWVIEAFHGCDGQGWEPPPCSLFAEHYQYVATKLDQIWCGTFQEVIKYIKERMSATVTVEAVTDQEITLTLTDDLDDALFDFPLTAKTEIPSLWEDVTLIQSGDSQTVTTVIESGTKYVYYDAVPDQGTIELYEKGQTPVNYNDITGNTSVDTDRSCMIYTLQGKLVYQGILSSGIVLQKDKLNNTKGVYLISYPKEEKKTRIRRYIFLH